MGFFDFLRRKLKVEEEASEQDWESISYNRDSVNIADSEERAAYVSGCLEQAAEASRELKHLSSEYGRVTTYLMDIEEIEALPEEERNVLNGIARRMQALSQEREQYYGKKNRMKDTDYHRLRQQESEVQEGIEKLRECESYGNLVKQDLQRLERERHAYTYRKAELENMMNNFRGMAVIFLTALAACVVMLMVLQYAFEMNTTVGYVISVSTAAVAITVLWVKYTDAGREKRRVERADNRLIPLQNKVKIRYVNNSNLQEYLCIKYATDSAASLEKIWKKYCQEKEERKQYAEAEAKLDYYRKQLLNRMSNYHVTAPGRWAEQAQALLDEREMVEIRHELILQRQALRKQMEYNTGVTEDARKEIMDLVNLYPAYAAEIMAMVDQYEDG